MTYDAGYPCCPLPEQHRKEVLRLERDLANANARAEAAERERDRVSKLWNVVRMNRPADVAGWRAVIAEKETQRDDALRALAQVVEALDGAREQNTEGWRRDRDAVLAAARSLLDAQKAEA